MRKKDKRVKKSIRSQIMACGMCPLVIMSTAVSLLILNGYDSYGLGSAITVILLLGVIQLTYVSYSIVKSIRMTEEYLNQLAGGNLDIVIDERLNKRDDEIGCMSQSLTLLKKKLKESMGDIQKVSNKLVDSEGNLEQVVGDVQNITEQIQTASTQIVINAQNQKEDMEDASMNMEEMNGLIANIVDSVEHLKDTSGKMQKDSKNSIEIMDNLIESNEHTNQVIQRINEQIYLTYKAAEKITAVTEMITSIARQTSLLSLNASIEAARAGESGRGFSVVAEEISVLANQSSASSKEINELIGSLTTESQKMLQIVDEVVLNAKKQKENLEETQMIFQKVNGGIEDSLHKIMEIGKQAEHCEIEKNKVTSHIQTLNTITQENVSYTKNTQDLIEELSKSICNTEKVAELLKEYACTLDEHMEYFSIEK